MYRMYRSHTHRDDSRAQDQSVVMREGSGIELQQDGSVGTAIVAGEAKEVVALNGEGGATKW